MLRNQLSHDPNVIAAELRNVPLALGLGTGAVIVIYLLLNALYLYVLPANELAAVKGSARITVLILCPARRS